MVRVKCNPKKARPCESPNEKIEDNKDFEVTFGAFSTGVMNHGFTSTPVRQNFKSESVKTEDKKPTIHKNRKGKKNGKKRVFKPAITLYQFSNVVKEITGKIANVELKWRKNAIKGLQAVAEEVIVELFDRARFCASQNKRTTVMKRDIRSAAYKYI